MPGVAYLFFFSPCTNCKTNPGLSAATSTAGAAVEAGATDRRPRALRNLTYLAGEVRKAGLR